MLPVNEPLMKLTPIIKAIGNFTVCFKIKFTLLLSELFCIPINKTTNKQELKIIVKKNFLIKFAVPSAVFKAMLPLKPSVTITSVSYYTSDAADE